MGIRVKDVTQADFHSAVQVLPLVSVDWVVVDADGRVLTGWRENAPARHSWFTPGGRIRKGEPWLAALSRVASVELGVDAATAQAWAARARLLGAWDHFYPDSAFCASTPTHYVNLPHYVLLSAAESALLKQALPHKLQAVDGPQAAYLAQHGAWRWLSPAEDAAHEQPSHAYVQPYLRWVADFSTCLR